LKPLPFFTLTGIVLEADLPGAKDPTALQPNALARRVATF